jgi:hypothetical protein
MHSINSGRVRVLLAIDGVAEYDERDDVAAKRRHVLPILARRAAMMFLVLGANAATPCKNTSDVRNVFIMVRPM